MTSSTTAAVTNCPLTRVLTRLQKRWMVLGDATQRSTAMRRVLVFSYCCGQVVSEVVEGGEGESESGGMITLG